MQNDTGKARFDELDSIVKTLSDKNLERLLWCAQGLSTNRDQRKFKMFKLNGRHPHIGEMTPCVTIGNLLFILKNVDGGSKSKLSETEGKVL
ncbi:MAG: hypothetical protein PHW73_06100 [Atribacterota bacterium]|nr:hypothetical protein [Atribacterota bacterium]